jgi:UDP-2,3-diacylglucosamine hydrolase
MAKKPIFLTSDVHLGVVPRETEASFIRWLEHASDRASEVVINGDLFDFWFEYRSAIPRGHTRVLGALAAVVDSGVHVTLMGGNHDWWGGDYLTEEVGVRFLRDPTVLDLAGLRTLLAHGDGVGAGDLGYRILKLILRGRLTIWAFGWLHPDLGAWLARRVSQTEYRIGGPTDHEKTRARELEKWARQHLVENRSLDLVVLAHTHVPALEEVEPRRWYANAGDWLNHRTYLVLQEGGAPKMEIWEEQLPLP